LHQFKQSKIDGRGTWPEFGKGMDLCVFTGDGILEELKNCSNERTKREKNRGGYEDQHLVRLIGMSSVHGDDVQ
jgi:hypothetical protein